MGVNNSDFEYMAHRRGDTQKDMFYVGAYLGFVADNKLRSLSGKTLLNERKNYSSFHAWARANGTPTGNGTSGYDVIGWYQVIYLQCMYVLKYKNLDSQTMVGSGVQRYIGRSAFLAIKTGGTETNGMDWGTTTTDNNSSTHVKLFGIEDLWGNPSSYIGGVWYTSNYHILTTTENFNDTGSGYTDRGNFGITSDVNGFSTKVIGTTHGGFLPLSTSDGSTTTYYCDSSYTRISFEYFTSYNCNILILGGDWGSYLHGGIFSLATTTNDSTGVNSSSMYVQMEPGGSGAFLMYV